MLLSCQEWNKQFESTWTRAASTVQRFAEQAELQQLGEQFLASAQHIAEQGEAFRAWGPAPPLAGGVEQRGGEGDGWRLLAGPGRGGGLRLGDKST